MTNDFQFQPKKRLFEKFDLFQKKKKKEISVKNFPIFQPRTPRIIERGRGGKERELWESNKLARQIKFVSIHFWPMIRVYYFRLPVPPLIVQFNSWKKGGIDWSVDHVLISDQYPNWLDISPWIIIRIKYLFSKFVVMQKFLFLNSKIL